MDFPAYSKNATVENKPLTVSAPAFDGNNTAKTVEAKRVEQQWRDVAASGVHKHHPLSINRDAAQVTSDPYNV